MKSNREEAIKECLKWEGGYTNDSADTGGPTNWGITLADARRYWKKEATATDVRAMPQATAVEIYRQKYWLTSSYNCDNLPAGLDLAVFDWGVNSGPSRAKKSLDKCTGSTVDKINQLMDMREAFLKQLKNFPTFGKGWMRRCKGIRAKALAMANAPVIAPEHKSAGGMVAGGAAAALAWPQYLPWIVGGTIILAVGTWLLVRWLKKGN